MFATSSDTVLKEIGTKQVPLILRASFSILTYVHENQLVRRLGFEHFRKGHWPVTFPNGGQSSQSIVQ